MASAVDPIVHVGDTVLSLEDPGALQFDRHGSEALEQTAPLAEEHRDDVELHLVEDPGGELGAHPAAIAAPPPGFAMRVRLQ